MEIVTEFRKELNRTNLRVKTSGLYREDYQVRMLRENTIHGLLQLQAFGEGEETVYEYNITGYVSLKSRYKKRKITAKEMKEFLGQIGAVMKAVGDYLLDPNKLLLMPDYIFYKEGNYSFCYFPQGRDDIRTAFHRLMDDFVQWTDYQDISSVKAAFLLHKETMRENYSLNQIIKRLEGLEKEEVKKDEKSKIKHTEDDQAEKQIVKEEKKETEALWQQEENDSSYQDWITYQEMGSRMVRETDDLWSPVKRLLRKHKRPKWGEWDGIYIDEEEF